MAHATRQPLEAAPLVRPAIQKLQGYQPGEQPKISGLVKLNTNENPYGPSPRVLADLKAAIDGRLRLYPNPTADRLRGGLARLHRCQPDNIIVGNGSDELLAMATRAFVEPLTGLTHYALERAAHQPAKGAALDSTAPEVQNALVPSRYLVQFFDPSYSLYPVLASIHGGRSHAVPLDPGFSLPTEKGLRSKDWDFNAALSYITTPNAPTGRGYTRQELEEFSRAHRGVLILDEAYVDFAAEHALELALAYPHVLVCRTFSKAYSLCALRVGYMVGHPDLIAALQKIRDSYNVNMLGQVAAEATLKSLPYYRKNFRRIIDSRTHVSEALAQLGFNVSPSQTNFIFVRPPRLPAEEWLSRLRDQKILVRWFSSPPLREYLRISIGSEAEMEQFLKAVRRILAQARTGE